VRRLAPIALALALLPAAAAAEETTYQPWSPPADTSSSFAAELRALVDKAAAARAADPKFLDDLRDLAAKYEKAAAKPLLSDDFADGDYVKDPTWTVASGRFSVDRQYGLRSTIALPAASSSSGGSQDLGLLVLQTVLTEIAKQQSGQATTSATISTAAAIPDAFAVEFEFGSLVAGGRIGFGPYVGADVSSGYRLVYVSGSTPALQLVAISGGRQSVVATRAIKAALEDRKRHALAWNRNLYGEMVVKLDGAEVVRVTDRTFREGFQGLAVTNLGGDFVVRRVLVTN
jgi:hypothetical protein